MQRRVRVHCQFTAWQFSHLLWRPQRCEGLSFWTLTKLLVLTNDQLRKALLEHTDWDDKLSNQWFTFRRHVRLHQTHSGRRLCCAFMRTGQTTWNLNDLNALQKINMTNTSVFEVKILHNYIFPQNEFLWNKSIKMSFFINPSEFLPCENRAECYY